MKKVGKRILRILLALFNRKKKANTALVAQKEIQQTGKWIEASKIVQIDGITIRKGLFYFGSQLKSENGIIADACLINPELEIDRENPDYMGIYMDYWPSYIEIEPQSRAAYIQWLASERDNPSIYIGYVFLYFYGIERRLLVDSDKGLVGKEERLALMKEIERLRTIYSSNYSFDNYSNNFLSYLHALHDGKSKTELYYQPASASLYRREISLSTARTHPLVPQLEAKHPTRIEKFKGCLLAGACGDALGAPVEFISLEEIKKLYGAEGIRDFAKAYGRVGAITDDTQMTLFTAEGLLRALVRYDIKGICHPPSVIRMAYIRWLITQDESLKSDERCRQMQDGWLIQQKELWARRAPGNTCLSALYDHLENKSQIYAKNDSKGCGTVMRIAPVGLLVLSERIFDLAKEVAALTHGHPTAQFAAIFLAKVINSLLLYEASLEEALNEASALLSKTEDEEVLPAIKKARALAEEKSNKNLIEELGEGWVAEEALAMAVYAVLSTASLEEAIIRGVNHSGDSDSVGSITGHIAGVFYGVDGIPNRWLEKLELREVIETIADDLSDFDSLDESNWQRYPGN